MHIILTNHCLQRREYLPKREEKEISKWIVFFIKKFHFKTKKDDIYIVKCKGNKAVIKKEKKRLVIITFIGFKDNLFKNKEKKSNSVKIRNNFLNKEKEDIKIKNKKYSKKELDDFFEDAKF